MNQHHLLLAGCHQRKRNKSLKLESPFLRLAKRIPPMYWSEFVGVTLDSRMGYTGKRQFHNLGQAINWAQSSVGCAWSNKSFCEVLNVDVLVDCTAKEVPQRLIENLK